MGRFERSSRTSRLSPVTASVTNGRPLHRWSNKRTITSTGVLLPCQDCARSTLAGPQSRRGLTAVIPDAREVWLQLAQSEKTTQRLVMPDQTFFLFSLFIAHHSPTCKNLTRTTLEKREIQTRSPRRRSAYPSGSFFPVPPDRPLPKADHGCRRRPTGRLDLVIFTNFFFFQHHPVLAARQRPAETELGRP